MVILEMESFQASTALMQTMTIQRTDRRLVLVVSLGIAVVFNRQNEVVKILNRSH